MTGKGPSRHTLDAVSRPENADNIDRLTSVADAVNGNESYAFDGVGNRTASHLSNTYTHQPFNRLTANETGSYSYDANGNTVSKVEGSKRWTYSWDYENRLTQAWDRKTRVRYQYDALGRRVERNLGFGRERTKFTYDGEDVLLDDANGTQTKYLNGPGIDNKLRSKTGGTANYYLADHLGSTNALTDSNGAITSQASYDGFGKQSGSLTTRYGFTGRERDDFTGLMHYRARHYDPKLGRFITEDPIGFAGGDVNLYGYVGNRPLTLRDPTGTVAIPAVAYAIFEVCATGYDVYDFYSTFSDPNSDWGDVALGGGGLLLGTALPGGGYGSLGKGAKRYLGNADELGELPKGGVYRLPDPDDANKTMRTGQTKDLVQREKQHRRDPRFKDLPFESVYRSDDYATRMGLEQDLYDNSPGAPFNFCRPIGKRNPNREKYMEAAERFKNCTPCKK